MIEIFQTKAASSHAAYGGCLGGQKRGPKLIKEKNITFFDGKGQLTLSQSTKRPQNRGQI
jgi:hypothetical protein